MAITFRDYANPDFSAANNLMSSASKSIAQVTETFGRMQREDEARQKMEKEAAQQAKANQVLSAIASAKNASEVQKAYGDLSGLGQYGADVVKTGIGKADSLRTFGQENAKIAETSRHNKAGEGIDKRKNEVSTENNIRDFAANMYGTEKAYESSIYGADRRKEASMYGSDKSLAAARLRAGATVKAAGIRARASGKNGGGNGPLTIGQQFNRAATWQANWNEAHPNNPVTTGQALAATGANVKDAPTLAKLMDAGKPKRKTYNDKEVISELRNYIPSTFDKKDQVIAEQVGRTVMQKAFRGELIYTASDGSRRVATPSQASQVLHYTVAGVDGINAYTKFGNIESADLMEKVNKNLSNMPTADASSTASEYNRRGRKIKKTSKVQDTIKVLSGQK